MKKCIALIFSLILSFANTTRADEGMWMLNFLEEMNMASMRDKGIQLTAEQIYSLNNSSVKDAIVIFGGGCTGEIVSEDGLLFTNHHCGLDQIQQHSTVDHDYLTEGFWATSRDEELPNPDLTVKFLDSIANVTEEIMQELSDDMLEMDRRKKINEIIAEIEAEASQEGKYEAEVEAFFNGNEYYLFTYTVYKDVRFVGAPPSSIGKFGYDTDNWQWPRHTGDFSIFRVYTDPDGSPAEYAEENIPLKPKHYLPISLNGVEKGDFTFIMGYPGSTTRYESSYGIEETVEVINANRIMIRNERLEILKQDMQNDPKVRIQYASKYSRSSNYWKYSIGQNKGIRRLKVLEKKREEEAEFLNWAKADSTRFLQYGNVLEELEESYTFHAKNMGNVVVIVEAFFGATEIIDFITEFRGLYSLLQKGEDNEEEIQEEVKLLKIEAEKFYKDYHLPTDIKMTKAMFKLYLRMVDPAFRPDIFEEIEKKYKGDINKFVDHLFDKTLFSDLEGTMAFLEKPTAKALRKDRGFEIAFSLLMKFRDEYQKSGRIEIDRLERLYMKGRLEMNPENNFYPDANSTMRITYGKVDNYSPADAVHYDEKTVLKGIIQKEDTTNFEFFVPEKLKELFVSKNYGRYGEEESMPVCFITNNDITGGNSGSPVMNHKGELIGLAFDGNLEAMSGDIAFEPDIQRCICVDIRYVLFIIEKYAGATHLIDELKIVN